MFSESEGQMRCRFMKWLIDQDDDWCIFCQYPDVGTDKRTFICEYPLCNHVVSDNGREEEQWTGVTHRLQKAYGDVSAST